MSIQSNFSVIIPVKNGLPYLAYSVTSVLASQAPNIELIVSVDGDIQEYEAFFSSIDDSRLRVIQPPPGLTMSEHWDFAQREAKGDWQLFLGQDDLLMSGYLNAFDFLTQAAKDKGVGVVVGRRAYVTWPPLGSSSLKALQYWESKDLKIRDSEEFVARALLSSISYHEGPQMYTTTLVAKEVIASIRNLNDGRLVLGHPQDAFIAASLLKSEKKFLFSGRPFSWVGSSIKSAGLAVASPGASNESSSIAAEYIQLLRGSLNLEHKSPVDFTHAVNSRYFIDALAIVWPEVFHSNRFRSIWFQVRVDSVAWSVLMQNKKSGIKGRQILFFPGFYMLKMLVGSFFVVVSKTSGSIRRFVSFALSKNSTFMKSFKSIDFIENPDVLFAKSLSIQSSYDPRD